MSSGRFRARVVGQAIRSWTSSRAPGTGSAPQAARDARRHHGRACPCERRLGGRSATGRRSERSVASNRRRSCGGAVERHGRDARDGRRVHADGVHTFGARCDEAPIRSLGVAQVMHRVDGPLEASQDQHEGEPDDRQAPASTAGDDQRSREHESCGGGHDHRGWPGTRPDRPSPAVGGCGRWRRGRRHWSKRLGTARMRPRGENADDTDQHRRKQQDRGASHRRRAYTKRREPATVPRLCCPGRKWLSQATASWASRRPSVRSNVRGA